MSQLTLRFSVVEKNDRGQEVELVRKALQFKPQVRLIRVSVKFCQTWVQQVYSMPISYHVVHTQKCFKTKTQNVRMAVSYLV